ncbi:MAG: phosphatidylserine decarboxylase [Lentisphaeria bacterium]|nr:phosphatidylserine decarboxylase [Lentisphaeria bacterium]
MSSDDASDQAPPEHCQYYDRRLGRVATETILGDRLLRLAYCSPARHLLAWPLFGNALLSRLMGFYADRPVSRLRIPQTIVDLNIDMDDFVIPDAGFRSFNDFFCRKLRPGAREFCPDPTRLCSPADCRLSVWPELNDDCCIPVKGAVFTVSELLGQEGADVAGQFRGGALCVCRLCPADYHRYHYPDNGRELRRWRIKGRYHSVNPLALGSQLRVFSDNVRTVSLLDLTHFGLTAFIEVGAFGVASIVQTHTQEAFARGDEKGLFAFGGSTIIMIFRPGSVRFDDDLVARSATGMECLVRVGEAIGCTPTTP